MGENWIPDITGRRGPLYKAIVDALNGDVREGRLPPGHRLPPHRKLAESLGVTLGTVTRAYGEARRQGLVVGEPGRGTYVRGDFSGAGGYPTVHRADDVIDLTLNQPAVDYGSDLLAETMVGLSRRWDLMTLLDYQLAPGIQRHRAAGSEWCGRAGVQVNPDQVVVCSGAQQGLWAAINCVARPGQAIACERLSYPGLRRITDFLGIQLLGVEADANGIVPDALEETLRRQQVAAIVCTPNCHNPTTATLTPERRLRIVELADTHDVPIIEDDVFGQLRGSSFKPLQTLLPDNVLYVSSVSKSLAPGFRLGYLAVPDRLIPQVTQAIHTTTWSASTLAAEVVTQWVEQGRCDRLLAWHHGEIGRRLQVLRQAFEGLDYWCDPGCYHVWLRLPPAWPAEEFAATLKLHRVAVTIGSVFAVSGDREIGAVRIGIGGPPTIQLLREAAQVIARVAREQPTVHAAII
ncbi:MAG: PLP-dependent aminotransferase family protein [Hyphomicrobiales bacterium]